MRGSGHWRSVFTAFQEKDVLPLVSKYLPAAMDLETLVLSKRNMILRAIRGCFGV
jgi:recombinational DNA repair protein RecT